MNLHLEAVVFAMWVVSHLAGYGNVPLSNKDLTPSFCIFSGTAKGELRRPPSSLTTSGTSTEVYGDSTYATASRVALGNPVTYLTNFAVDKLSSVTSNVLRYVLPASVSLAYDTNENMVLSGTNILQYDAQNQLTNILYPSLTTGNIEGQTALLYDGLGRLRIRREYGPSGLTNEVRYIYSGFTVLQQRDGNNNPLVSYTVGSGLLARTDANGSAYYQTDGNGNVTALVDADGSLKARYLYDPFGNLLAKSGPLADVNTRRFSSKEHHAQSGLYYYGFRWYDPSLQRWLSADPIGLAGGRNKHAFVKNDPIGRIDTLGLMQYYYKQPWTPENWGGFIPGSVPSLAASQRAPGVAGWVNYAVEDVIATGVDVKINSWNLVNNTIQYLDTIPEKYQLAFMMFGGELVGTMEQAAMQFSRVLQSLSLQRLATSITKCKAADTGALVSRASEVHSALDPIAQQMRTTAVLETSGGRVVAAGGRDLTLAQRLLLGPGETAARLPGEHAEITALHHAGQNGSTPQAIGIYGGEAGTRVICPECEAAIRASGGTLTSPTTAVWPR
jgi:RHS repeat-associated protein